VSLVPGKVGIYTCGHAVYMFAHIGNFRAYISSDTLRRVMEYLGYEVRHVMNVTDVGHLTSARRYGRGQARQRSPAGRQEAGGNRPVLRAGLLQ